MDIVKIDCLKSIVKKFANLFLKRTYKVGSEVLDLL